MKCYDQRLTTSLVSLRGMEVSFLLWLQCRPSRAWCEERRIEILKAEQRTVMSASCSKKMRSWVWLHLRAISLDNDEAEHVSLCFGLPKTREEEIQHPRLRHAEEAKHSPIMRGLPTY